jgi:hypothetical protein
MVPAFCEDARDAWETVASGTLQHGLWGVRAGTVPAIEVFRVFGGLGVAEVCFV